MSTTPPAPPTSYKHLLRFLIIAIGVLLAYWPARVAVFALALDRPHVFLILLQNNDELRPTGGFIGTYATVTISRGKVAEFEFADSYSLRDKVGRDITPPEPLAQAGIADWQFHDSNWSPDFPTSAGYARDFYHRATGREVDGVVAIDAAVLEPLLRAVGPVSVSGAKDAITADNVRREIEARRPTSPDQEATHKEFIREVVQSVLARLRQSGLAGLWRIAPGLAQAAAERHIMLVLNEDVLASVLHRMNCDGSILGGEGDYLMVVDANLYGNKVEPDVTEVLLYEVDLSDPLRPLGTLTVAYQHQGSMRWLSGVYKDYRRVYVPGGSRLTQAGGRGPNVETVVGTENGRAVWGDWFWLEPGGSSTVTYSYHLPARVVSRSVGVWHYELQAQKQSGTGGRPLAVKVRLPAEANVSYVNQRPYSQSLLEVTFQTTLVTDRRFVVEYTSDQSRTR